MGRRLIFKTLICIMKGNIIMPTNPIQFKIGDKVRILPVDEVLNLRGVRRGIIFNHMMEEYCESITTIAGLNGDNTYTLECNERWVWCAEWLELAEAPTRFKVGDKVRVKPLAALLGHFDFHRAMSHYAECTTTIYAVFNDGSLHLRNCGDWVWHTSWVDLVESKATPIKIDALPLARQVEAISKLRLTERQRDKLNRLGDCGALEYLRSFLGVERRVAVKKYAQFTPDSNALSTTLNKLRDTSEQHVPWSSKKRFVGIELEFCLPRVHHEKLKALKILGMCVKDDGSVRTQYELLSQDERDELELENDADVSVEVNLLLVQGAGYDKLEALLNFLNEHDAYVNHTCGLHVHLDQRHNDQTEAKKVFSRLQNSVAPILSKLVSQSRLTPAPGRSNYCRLNREASEKYQAVNFLTYRRKNTIEVRLHHGTLDLAEIANWVDLLISLSELQGMAAPKKPPTWDSTMKRLSISEERKAVLREIAMRRMAAQPLTLVREA